MLVYLKSREDWVDFVNGKKITAYIEKIEGYYKMILVAQKEIISRGRDVVIIEKWY